MSALRRILRRVIVVLVFLGFVCASRDLLFDGNLAYWFQWLLLVTATIQVTPYLLERWRK